MRTTDFKIDISGCTDRIRFAMAKNLLDGDEDPQMIATIEYKEKMAIDMYAYPPNEYDEDRWTYGFWYAPWIQDYTGDGEYEGTGYVEDFFGKDPVVDITWLSGTWKCQLNVFLINLVTETYKAYVKENFNMATKGEYDIYRKSQRENDLDDAESIYEELWEEGMPMKLPENVAEQIVEKFRHWHDWTVSDYDQLKGYVEEAMENLKPKGPSFHDDVDKMIDFFHLSREDFLKRYYYLTEAAYDATIEAVRQQCDIKETVAEGVALYALIMLRDYKSED